MSNFVEETSAIRAEMEIIANCLSKLSMAFGKTGNRQVEDELEVYSEKLWKLKENLSKAVAEEINRGWKNSQEMSKTILETALASGKGK